MMTVFVMTTTNAHAEMLLKISCGLTNERTWVFLIVIFDPRSMLRPKFAIQGIALNLTSGAVLLPFFDLPGNSSVRLAQHSRNIAARLTVEIEPIQSVRMITTEGCACWPCTSSKIVSPPGTSARGTELGSCWVEVWLGNDKRMVAFIHSYTGFY